MLGLSDVIVDIVETGSTLRENNLEVSEKIVDISARLIANKANYKFKRTVIDDIVKKIGLIATTATVKSNAYARAIKPFGIEVFSQSCPRLVKIVESGKIDSQEAQIALSEYLKPLLEENIEKLILGCTHYPFLIPTMKKLGLKDGFFINPAVCLSIRTKEFLKENNLLNKNIKGQNEFFVSGNPDEFKRNAKLFFDEIDKVTVIN